MRLSRRYPLPVVAFILCSAQAQDTPNRPAIFFTDVTAGPVTGGPGGLGTPVSIFGKGFGSTRGTSKVTIGGVEVASYLTWGRQNASNSLLDMVVVQPGPGIVSGAVEVIVGGIKSTGAVNFQRTGGRIYTISASGADSAPCTETAPCRTLLSLLGVKARAGDVVLVRGGEYNDGEIWIRGVLGMSGREDQPLVIRNYPNEVPVYSNPSRPLIIDASYVTISGLHLRNGKSMGVSEHLENVLATPKGVSIVNSSVVGPIGYEGIGLHGDHHLLAGNFVKVESSTQGTQGHCFYVSYGSGGRILYNIADGAPGYGMHIFDQVRQQGDFRRVIADLLIEGNVVRNSPQRSGMILVMDDGGSWGSYGNYAANITIRNNLFVNNNHHGLTIGGIVRGVRVYNNTFFENGRQGIYVGEARTTQDIDVRNNLIYQTANNGYCRSNCSWYSMAHIQDSLGDPLRVRIDNNGYFPGAPVLLEGSGASVSPIQDPHPVTGTLAFRNFAILDFQIEPASAVVDSGLSLAEVPRDFNGGLRPLGAAKFDIGAFEFGSGPATNGSTGPMPPAPAPTPSPAPAPQPQPQPQPSGTCTDGKITSPCLCGGALRSDNYCCKGNWHSYDACQPAPSTPSTPPCKNGPITSPCVCGGGVRSDNFCCNGNWHSYDACRAPSVTQPRN